MTKYNTKSQYYPNLDGLRFLSCVVIWLAHGELTKAYFGIPNVSYFFLKPRIAYGAVTCFFVLSGFLITSLLLTEKKENGYFSLKHFYLRRIFRLWPLYFIYIGIFFLASTYLVQPFTPEPCAPMYDHIYIIMLLQLGGATAFATGTLGLSHLWSVGVEEQFYLAWPLILRFSKRILRTIFILVSLLVLGKLLFSFYAMLYTPRPDTCEVAQVRMFFTLSRYECMLAGCWVAIVYHRYPSWVVFLHRKSTQWACVAGIALIFALDHLVTYFDQVAIAIPFAILVLNMATNEQTIIRTRGKFISRMGKLSYGLYIWHQLIILLMCNVMISFYGLQWNLLTNVLYYSITAALTLGVVQLSYIVIEKPFLKLKPY